MHPQLAAGEQLLQARALVGGGDEPVAVARQQQHALPHLLQLGRQLPGSEKNNMVMKNVLSSNSAVAPGGEQQECVSRAAIQEPASMARLPNDMTPDNTVADHGMCSRTVTCISVNGLARPALAVWAGTKLY